MKDLTKGNTTKALLNFAFPIFLGSLFNLAYNLADIRIVGTYLGDEALAAIGGVSPLSDLLNTFIVGTANGFGVIIARYFGKKEEKEVRKNFALSMVLGLIIVAITVLCCILGLNGILRFLNISPANLPKSSGYIRIIMYGLIFSAIYNILVAALRAIGDAYTPLIFLIASTMLNVVFDIIMVALLGLGLEGAATATIISQMLAAVACSIYTYIRYPILRFKFKELTFKAHYLGQLLSSGFSMALMTSLVVFGTFSLQTAINSLGDTTIVAHTSARKLSSIFMMPFGVIGTAMATFTGQNYGAGRLDRVREGIKKALIINYVWCAIVLVITYTVAGKLVVLITDTKIPEVVETAVLYQKINTILYFLVPTISVLRNSLQGLGSHIIPLVSSFIELAVKCILAFVFTPLWGYWAIIFSEPVSWIIMVVPLIICMIHYMKKAGQMSSALQ